MPLADKDVKLDMHFSTMAPEPSSFPMRDLCFEQLLLKVCFLLYTDRFYFNRQSLKNSGI